MFALGQLLVRPMAGEKKLTSSPERNAVVANS